MSLNGDMKILRMKRWILVFGFWSSLISLSAAAGTKAVRLIAQPESKIWLTGDSTLHAYQSNATQMTISAEMGKNILRKLDVDVPVKGLKSSKKGLDKNVTKLLLADQNPSIHFQLVNQKIPPISKSLSDSPIEMTGDLSLAGITKTITLKGVVEELENGFHVQGEKELLMSDFGIEPPVMLMLKTDDQVVIHYDIFLKFEKN